MKTCLTVFIFAAVMLLAGAQTHAKTLFLKDGTEIDFKKAWQQGGRVFVLVNRDTLLDFAPEEINVKKSLRSAKLHKFPRLGVRKHRKAGVTEASAPQRKAVGNDSVEAGNPLVFNDSSSNDFEGSGKRAGSARESGRVQDLSQELMAIYEGLHNAMKSRNVGQVKQYLSAKHVAAMGEREKAMIEAGISLRPPNVSILGSSASPDGTSAVLNLSARMDPAGVKSGANGTVSFVRENSLWKLDQESWDIQIN